MSGALEIRLARPEEYAAVDQLVQVAYAHDYGPSDQSSDPMRLAAHRALEHDVWVAVEAGAAAGAAPGTEAGAAASSAPGTEPGAAAGTAPGTPPGPALLGSVTTRRSGRPPLHEDFAAALDLRLLAVSPDARRRGVGAALMRHIIEIAPSRGFDAVALKTAPNMVGAHRLYESLGFQRWPERDGLWINGVRLFDLFSYVYPLTGASEPAAGAALAVAGSSQAPQT